MKCIWILRILQNETVAGGVYRHLYQCLDIEVGSMEKLANAV